MPIGVFAARTGQTVIALQHAVAYREGCILALHVAARRGPMDKAAWHGLVRGLVGRDRELTRGDDGLKLGVRFPDGSKATPVRHAFPGWAQPADRPEPPMLVEAGGGSSGGDQSYQGDEDLWLWPLPPPGPFEFVTEWRARGIGPVSVQVDGKAIVRAAEQAQPYWPA